MAPRRRRNIGHILFKTNEQLLKDHCQCACGNYLERDQDKLRYLSYYWFDWTAIQCAEIMCRCFLIAKLRRIYRCGNVKSNCNFVFHNGERKEITWERKRAQVIFKDVQMVQTLERKERTGRENRQTAIRVHNHITFRVWHVISFLSPLWKTKLQLDFTLPQR